jgi:rod shape-determining protein MreD
LIFSVQHGWSISYKAGFISGMIYDLSCGTFGVFMLIFTVLGFAAGHLKGKLFFGKLIFPFLASFLLVIYKSLMLGFLYLISGKSDFVPLGSILNILIELGMTIATGMILYFILSVTRIIDLNSKEYIL